MVPGATVACLVGLGLTLYIVRSTRSDTELSEQLPIAEQVELATGAPQTTKEDKDRSDGTRSPDEMVLPWAYDLQEPLKR